MTVRVALYARYSTENQREASIEDQLRVCRQRAERAGWEIVAEFSDAATSGTIDDRPGLNALRQAIRRRAIDKVLVENLNRLSRDEELSARIKKECSFAGVDIATLETSRVSELEIAIKGISDAETVRMT